MICSITRIKSEQTDLKQWLLGLINGSDVVDRDKRTFTTKATTTDSRVRGSAY